MNVNEDSKAEECNMASVMNHLSASLKVSTSLPIVRTKGENLNEWCYELLKKIEAEKLGARNY